MADPTQVSFGITSDDHCVADKQLYQTWQCQNVPIDGERWSVTQATDCFFIGYCAPGPFRKDGHFEVSQFNPAACIFL